MSESDLWIAYIIAMGEWAHEVVNGLYDEGRDPRIDALDVKRRAALKAWRDCVQP